MERRSRRLAGWKGRLLLVLSLVAAVGPAWAATYLCPMARAEAPRIRSSCCAHEVEAAGTFTVAFRQACHCPIPTWQAGAADQERSASASHVDLAPVAPGLAAAVPSPVVFATPRTAAVVPTGPPLWVRHQSILC